MSAQPGPATWDWQDESLCPFCAGLSPQWMQELDGAARHKAFALLPVHRRVCALRDTAVGSLARDVPDTWLDDTGKTWMTPRCFSALGKFPGHVALRKHVARRDSGQCPWCHDASVLVDHIIPWRIGGAHHPSNLRVLCNYCNSTKAAFVDVPRIAGALRRAVPMMTRGDLNCTGAT